MPEISRDDLDVRRETHPFRDQNERNHTRQPLSMLPIGRGALDNSDSLEPGSPL